MRGPRALMVSCGGVAIPGRERSTGKSAVSMWLMGRGGSTFGLWLASPAEGCPGRTMMTRYIARATVPYRSKVQIRMPARVGALRPDRQRITSAHFIPASRPRSSPSPACASGRAPGSGHKPSHPSSRCRCPHTANALPPSPFLQISPEHTSQPGGFRCRRVCFGEDGMKQQSDIRAHRQHSTVPVERTALPRQATLRAHRHRSRTGIDRNTLNQFALRPRPAPGESAPRPAEPAHAFSNPTAEAQRPSAATLRSTTLNSTPESTLSAHAAREP